MSGNPIGDPGESAQRAPAMGISGWLASAAIVQLTAALLLRRTQVPGDWALLLGSATGAILPLWLLLWFGLGRGRDPRGWWKIPLLLWPLSVIAMFPGPGPDTLRYWQAGVSIADVGQRITDADPDWAGAPGQRPREGEIGAIDRIGLEFVARVVADGRAYRRDLVATGLDDMLAPELLRSRADLPGARRKVEAAREIVARYSALSATRLAAVRRQLEQAPVGAAARSLVLRGLRDAQSDIGPIASHVWQLERDIVEARSGLLDVLERGGWTRAGQAFEFAAPASRADFDTRLEDVRAAREEQEALRAERRALMRDMIRGSPL